MSLPGGNEDDQLGGDEVKYWHWTAVAANQVVIHWHP